MGPAGHELDLPDRTMLPAEPDATFDHMVALTRRILDVPTAVVSLVDRERQVFPGASGLPEPWAQLRSTPLTHSFCQYVVTGAQPLIVSDARQDPRLAENLAVTELGVVAYAGIPLRDSADRVIGSLCAIDEQPRDWSDVEITNLHGLAEACQSELRLREVSARATLAVERERIARDLHTEVFSDLLTLSMLLGTAHGAVDGDRSALIESAQSRVDLIMKNIGTSVFGQA